MIVPELKNGSFGIDRRKGMVREENGRGGKSQIEVRWTRLHFAVLSEIERTAWRDQGGPMILVLITGVEAVVVRVEAVAPGAIAEAVAFVVVVEDLGEAVV